MIKELYLKSEEFDKYRPNHLGHASVCNFEDSNTMAIKHTNEEIATTVKASVDLKTGQITALIDRLDIILKSIKSSLRNGATVETVQTFPCTISIAIGKSGSKYHLLFSVSVLRSRSKSRIARKPFYIKVMALMTDFKDDDEFQHFMYAMFSSEHGSVI